ncbi:hypothetical protein SH584_08430 [Sphingomonas sp. LY29]|uniref:hypothetical protein n=1 Tax=Sphingomonas sp. LY29 TaxID=3095341 RepID=UPI002D789A2D|nr:hypothetical protein [Sphingomonas sp. LY29]WRP25077.1 hypothetical protein SH584_08430 [Sphingomonas sp. LY29]
MSMLLPVVAALMTAVGQPVLSFDIKGGGVVLSPVTGQHETVTATWTRLPVYSDFSAMPLKSFSREATFYADCNVTPAGRLTNCRKAEFLPDDDPALRSMAARVLDLLIMEENSAEQLGSAKVVYVSVYMKNPGGIRGNRRYCGEPFCISTPPPPPPPPPGKAKAKPE